MALIPPQPAGSLPGSGFWNDWIEKIRTIVNNLSEGLINHNDLQNIQGGSATERYHLSNANNTALTGTRVTKGTDTTDDLIVDTNSKGLVLKDNAGTPHYWRVSVSTLGVLTTTDLGTTKP